MGLRETGTIDIILERPAFETEACKLILMIIDATSDLTDEQRLELLIKKLAGYVAYVESKKFAKEYPDVRGADVIVRVLTVVPPTIEMQMVDAVRKKEGRARLRVVFADYHEYMRKVKGVRKLGESGRN